MKALIIVISFWRPWERPQDTKSKYIYKYENVFMVKKKIRFYNSRRNYLNDILVFFSAVVERLAITNKIYAS